MIEYIRGELTELTPALATVEAAGVGYGLNISLNTYTTIQRHLHPSVGQQKDDVKLYVYEAIREDAYVLYGFASKKEREMFELLVVDEIPAGGAMQTPVNNEVKDEAVSALTMLGFSPAPTQKVVVQILQEQPSLPVEQVVKLALKQIK